MRISLHLVAWLVALVSMPLASCHQKEEITDPTKESIFDQFVRDTIVHLTIKTDFRHLFENKEEAEYQPAELSSAERDGREIKKEIRVSARGVTRKKICAFPPLKLQFSKEDLVSEDLLEFRTLKLVTHCLDSMDSEQLLLKEFLAYKLLHLLTEESFHVQLAKVRYIDVNDRYPSREKYAFLIENNKEMAVRLQGELLGEDYQLQTINKDNYNLLALFQFMIGNTDWNLARHHNIKLVLPHGDEVPVAIPYDFDYSGLVNAPYAVPYASLPVKNVRQRFLQWRGTNSQDLEPAIRLFEERKEEILHTCRDLPGLRPEVREDILRYLGSFYEIIENPDRLKRELVKKK